QRVLRKVGHGWMLLSRAVVDLHAREVGAPPIPSHDGAEVKPSQLPQRIRTGQSEPRSAPFVVSSTKGVHADEAGNRIAAHVTDSAKSTSTSTTTSTSSSTTNSDNSPTLSSGSSDSSSQATSGGS